MGNPKIDDLIRSFDERYQSDTPPGWEIGTPQREIIRLEEEGKIKGSVLDAGCGSGENALYLASRSHHVVGIDFSQAAIHKALAKVNTRRVEDIHFETLDALMMQTMEQSFDTIIDVGLFHVFSDVARPKYAESVRSVLVIGGLCIILCFSDHEPGDWGPRRVTQQEIRETFSRGFDVEEILPARFDTNHGPDGVRAWRAMIRRTM